MARIGLDNLKYSKLDANGAVTTPASFGKAIDCKVSLEKNSATLYADNALVESDYSLKSGTITLTVDDDDDTIFAELLGHTVTTGETVRNATDQAPYVAIGRILTKLVNSSYKYKVEFLSKVRFSDTMPDEETKGESIDFKGVSVEGAVLIPADGVWSKTKTFTSRSEAEAYLTQLLTAPTV